MNHVTIKITVALLLLISLYQGQALPAEIICDDVADLYIDEWKPDENLNYEAVVKAATNTNVHHGIARALFKFDVPNDLAAAAITSATIYVSGCSDCGGGKGGQAAWYALNEPFDENADTWNSLEGGSWDDSVYARAELPGGNDWNEAVNGEPPADAVGFDVTRLLKRNLEKARANGVMLRFYDEHQDPYTHQSIASRESDNPLDFAPYMAITTRGGNPCPAEVVFNDSTEKIESLRRFRNQVLAKSAAGRYIIALYYRSAPFLSAALRDHPSLTAGVRRAADVLIPPMIRLF